MQFKIHYIAKSIRSPVQMFQSLLWPQLYEIKHLGMQTVSTNICERTDGFQELSEFQRGTVIGCHLYNTFSHEIVAPKYSTINCQWYYKKVEAIGNDSNSTTKGLSLDSRAVEACSLEGQIVLSGKLMDEYGFSVARTTVLV
ncbi:hypothetical protein AMECASPLE_003627 [Ameca splendens]|uniref:Uncharacterized protein n=1 Tax=Ameca splendens TaxID=208324 RepID=A0ABV0ZKH5_9TELE